jgi:hypothetical protein
METIGKVNSTRASTFQELTDGELLDATTQAAADERRSTVELVELLSEVDARRLYLGEGCSSLFTYCTEVLHLSEPAAYHRIEAARATRLFPVVAACLRDGSLTLTTVALLRPHLTLRNHSQLLVAARNESKREVEHQIACLNPKPEVVASIRRLPGASSPADMETSSGALLGLHAGIETSLNAPAHRAWSTAEGPKSESEAEQESAPVPAMAAASPVLRTPTPKIEPLASDRYLLRISLSAAGHANLRRAQELMRHTLSRGDLAGVVWKRDSGRCTFIGARGRCSGRKPDILELCRSGRDT